jgi:mannosyltransferase OCH1-like enzyme
MESMPKNIFQTHKSKDYIKSHPPLFKAVSSWIKYKKDFNYVFFDNENCDKFIKENFDEKTYKAYSMLPMAVMKADLWRYCVIYKYGGIYADADTVCKVNPNIFINDSLITIVAENETHLCQWVFSAPANSPILKSVIDLSVERILTTPIKGEHIIHHLTGPGVFTHGIEKYLKENNKPIFANKHEYFNYPDKSLLRVFNHNNFHKNIVTHLFAGQYNDGWYHERFRKLT